MTKEELLQNIEEQKSENTERSTKTSLNNWKSWCQNTGETRKIEEKPKEELNELLKHFYWEIRKTNGEDFKMSKMAGRTFSVLCKFIALLQLLPVLFCNRSLKLTPESISFCERPEIAVLHHPTLSFGPFYFINFHAVLTSVKARSNSELVNHVCKATKHGIVALPSRLYKIDLTIHMDIKGNPGPERNENDALSRNQRCPPCCSHQTNRSRKPLSVLYANARRIVNKRHLLDLELSKRPFDIIVLMETHLDDSIFDAEIFSENYTVFRQDRSQNGRQGGGILIATSDFLRGRPPKNRPTRIGVRY